MKKGMITTCMIFAIMWIIGCASSGSNVTDLDEEQLDDRRTNEEVIRDREGVGIGPGGPGRGGGGGRR